MGKYNYNSRRDHIQGLLGYILDVKPYHSKLTEIIEQYQFYDTINIKITDKWFSKTTLSSKWEKTYTSDGYRTRFIIPSFNLPRYSIERSDYLFNIGANYVSYLSEIYNIKNSFALRANTGIESVIVNNESLAEGIDYFISQGVYSFKTNSPELKRYWHAIDNANYISEVDPTQPEIVKPFSFPNLGSLVSHRPDFTPIEFYTLDLNLKDNSQDEWTVQCFENSVSQNVLSNADFNQHLDSDGNVWYTVTLNHSLNSQNLIWQFYTNDGGLFTSYEPHLIECVDNNTLSITTADQVQLYASLTSIPSSSIFESNISTNIWHVYHPFRTQEAIIETRLVPKPDNLHYEIRNVNPSQVDIHFYYTISGLNPDLSGKTFILPVSPSSKFIQPELLDTWTFDATNYGVDFESGIIPFFQVYSQDTLYTQNAKPVSISILPGNIVTLTFDHPLSGYVLISTPGSVNWLSVKSKIKGLLGYAYTNGIFNHRDIKFELLSSFDIGSTAHIAARKSGFTIHPNAPEETWSLIKINPISYDKPLIGYTGFPKVTVYAAQNYIEQDWTITCINVNETSADFEIIGENGYTYGPFSVSLTEPSTFKVDNVLEFEIYPSLRGFRIGDFFTFNLGYDGDQYDLSGLEGNGTAGAPYDIEQVGYDHDADNFDPPPSEYTEQISENWPDAPDPIEGGLYDAEVLQLIDNWTNITFELQPAKDTVKLLPLAAEFTFAPTERWTFTYNEAAKRFDVSGSISGPQAPAYIAREYDNGFIRVRLVNPNELINLKKLNDDAYLSAYVARMTADGNLTDGLKIYFQLREKRPNYLVVGSTTGQLQECVVGEYFWNGQIGFKLDLPSVKICNNSHYPITLNVNSPYEFLPNATITTITPPRFDANPERIDLKFHNAAFLQSKLTENRRQFLVNSSLRGQLPAAIIGQQYFDIETSRSMPENHDLFNFRIDEVDLSIVQDTQLSLVIEAHPYQSMHSDGFILLQPEYNAGTLKINSFREDIFNISINHSHPELGSETALIPSYITAANDETVPVINSYIPDRREEYDVWLTNVKNKKIGTISWKLDSQVGQYKQVLDFTNEFNTAYLPLNSVVSFSTRQADQYNDLVKVKISEHLYFRNEVISHELINVHIAQKHNFVIHLIIEETASVLVDLIDQSFGWDTFAWDTDEFDRNRTNKVIHINLRDQDIGGYDAYLYDLIDYDKTLFTSVNTQDLTLNIANTKISDYGLSIAMTSPSENIPYDDDIAGYDMTGYEILESALMLFEQMKPVKAGLLWPTPYTLIDTQTSLVEATIELPQAGLSILLARNKNDIAGSQLTLGIDYILELLNTDNINEVYKIVITNPEPIIILAYI